MATVSPLTQAANEQVIPGPRDCFWARGPVSADPYVNIAYPDSSVFYWAAMFTVPDGARLDMAGEFAHSRYQSLISYDNRGRPVESVADYLIEPNKGSINPFRAGARRDSRHRDYTIEVVGQALSTQNVEGKNLAGLKRNKIHAPAFSGQQALLYRIYAPDDKANESGGVDLPKPVLTLADGRRLTGSEACKALKTNQPLQITLDALGIPTSQYRELISQPDKPDTWPAVIPAKWHIQLDRKSLIGIYTGDINYESRRSAGGFYPNPDNNYIRTIVNRRHGPVVVIRAKMPTTPKTFDGDKKMTDAQLRYWSICSNQSFANTRVNDCLFDEEVPLDQNGYYTIVISREADRPRNARQECGMAWLPMADDGDGVFDKDVSIIQIRNMLASDDFKQAIQNVEIDGTAEEVMGEYYPQLMYTMTNAVEVAMPCNT
ncbi:hypothetical protein [Sinobacterium norvegicum]|uniref:hypothetical protein n=1 Tax=Sinobacterium norvegicum TaxID=1641715 RepID=UPI001F363C9F|nr:hypothetical protein [Sinobacterium norvegicum]